MAWPSRERGFWQRVALAALLAAVSELPAWPQDLPKPGERWSAATADDLSVLGQASSRRVEEIARDLALARAAVLAIAAAPDHRAPYPTTVILFRDDATLLAYHRQADGSPPPRPLLSALDRQGRVLGLSLENVERDLPAAREVLAADLVDQLLVNPPPWLSTGLAGLIARLEPAGGSAAARTVERLPPAATAGETAWPAPDVLRAAKPGDYREAAIGLVRHLAHPRSERSSQLRRYLTLLRGGMPGDAAFEECFFEPFASLYSDVALVAARGGSPAVELEPRPPAVAPAPEPSYEDVVVALGELLVHALPWNTVAAEAHFRAALDRRPHDAAALRGIALARELDGRHDDAVELWEKSLAAAPRDATTRTLYGWSRLDYFRRVTGTRRGWEDPLPAEVAAARDLFVSAMSDGTTPVASTPPEAHAAHGHDLGPPIRPDASPHALHGYGATFLFARSVIDPAIAALERAARLLPGDDEIAADFVLLHAHAGNHDLAWELRGERLLGRAAPTLDAAVEKLLVEESLHAADQFLLVAEKPEPAIALVERAAAEVREPATRQELERLLSQMRQVAAELGRNGLFDRFVVAYENAKRLVGERRFADARALLQPFAAEDVDAAVRDPARDALRQIDQVDPAP